MDISARGTRVFSRTQGFAAEGLAGNLEDMPCRVRFSRDDALPMGEIRNARRTKMAKCSEPGGRQTRRHRLAARRELAHNSSFRRKATGGLFLRRGRWGGAGCCSGGGRLFWVFCSVASKTLVGGRFAVVFILLARRSERFSPTRKKPFRAVRGIPPLLGESSVPQGKYFE